MSIITISRGSYSRGKVLAEKIAAKLHYECISREVLLEASDEFNIPEIKLIRAIHDAPSILEQFSYGRQRYIAFIQAAISRHFQKDNIVYCGLAGHFFLRDIAHALKVRIVIDLAERVQNEVQQEGISAKRAEQRLAKDDRARRKWGQYLYGVDTQDPHNYDMVFHIKNITVDDAVEIICNTVALPQFQTTPESQKAMDDLALAAQVKVALVNTHPDVEVQAANGAIRIVAATSVYETEAVTRELEAVASSVPGVKSVAVDIRLIDPIE